MSGKSFVCSVLSSFRAFHGVSMTVSAETILWIPISSRVTVLVVADKILEGKRGMTSVL